MKTINRKLFIAITAVFMLLMVGLITRCNAQDKRFTVFGYTDPGATVKDGFNIGVGIEYQMTVNYFKAQTFVFPNLRGKTYTEITGTPLGFNLHFLKNQARVYTGLKLGAIIRDGGPHATAGIEAGIDYYFNGLNNGLYVGLIASKDYRTDGKVWEVDIEPYWRNSGFIKIGYAF